MIQYLNILLNGRLAKMEERGATAVEYGLLVALIAAVIIAAVILLGNKLDDAFGKVNSSLGG
ncbi:Flp family type IVb pilin [Nocardioides kongjuensis]|jgi:pilus assembly protein Flp/PilA|uniref:Pilus assembly protein Flp/PilA n=1 Tax=Nocardioides kongjuensis TaxID=349522 RepID=A0A852RQS3_9ACTN|nr:MULTISPECIES: Flp family type IVb pilin [Nocardioides]NYD30294.1 pilus assembly protein Flp/PilA [Nocardioides kongjuensis]TQK70615.1 pilus assembly protein Flp/PilA [Nocardioides sp. SLBN-35]WGX99997.1 Flp family type IVb pilin [Nocardioides sp. QY071]